VNNKLLVFAQPIEGGDNAGEIQSLLLQGNDLILSLPYGFQVRESGIDVIGDCVFCFHHQVSSVYATRNELNSWLVGFAMQPTS
jgi:hypothetical protein